MELKWILGHPNYCQKNNNNENNIKLKDESFLDSQFSTSVHRMFRHYRNYFGGGLCIYTKKILRPSN